MHHARIDKLAGQHSIVHGLDPRVKLIAAVAFSVYVLSIQGAMVSFLPCCAIGPFAVLVIGKVPLKFVFKQILIVSPFIVVLAMTSLFYDKSIITVSFGPAQWQTTAGMLRCISIVLKFIITMMVLIGLTGTTRFGKLLSGLGRLGVPRMLVMQIGFVYRFIFLLIDRAHHILMARTARKTAYMGFKAETKTAAAMVGSLFLGSIDTAEKVNTAMQARGFDGRFRNIKQTKFGVSEAVFLAVVLAYIVTLHLLSGVF